MLTAESIKKYLVSDIDVFVYERLASTNLTARQMFNDGVRRISVVIARSQDNGRGRLGRSFFSPNGGLYMSVLIPHVMESCMSLRITTAAAVAVSRAIDGITGRRSGIKWVNDVYLDDKKVCGILTEGGFTADGQLSHAVLGIGINLTPPDCGFPDEIKERAGAVFQAICEDADARLAAAVVENFLTLYENGLAPSLYADEYRSRSVVIGRRINVMRIHDGSAVAAVAVGISDDFGLNVRYDDASEETLSSGDVSLRM